MLDRRRLVAIAAMLLCSCDPDRRAPDDHANYSVTLYDHGRRREWTCTLRPHICGGGFEFWDISGKRIIVSGNVVIESIREEEPWTDLEMKR